MHDTDDLRRRYTELNGVRPASAQLLSSLEEVLGVTLPSAFMRVCSFYDGSGVDVVPMYSLSGNAPTSNPLSQTLRLRAAIRLPAEWLVLAEPPESLIVMECAEPGRVLWLDATDAERLATQGFMSPPDEWSSFAEFFGEMLDEEESERAG